MHGAPVRLPCPFPLPAREGSLGIFKSRENGGMAVSECHLPLGLTVSPVLSCQCVRPVWRAVTFKNHTAEMNLAADSS